MPISVEEALSAYGYVYDIARAIPELNGILDQAVSGGWTSQKLTATIESSPWWKNNADTVRNLAIQKAAEPGTYRQNLNNAKNLIVLKAQQLGRGIDDKTATRLALNTLTTNASWDDQVLSQLVTNNTGLAAGGSGAAMGQAAAIKNHLSKVFDDYGVAYTRQWMDFATNQIESGRDSVDGFESWARARAKATYPHLAAQIDGGMTVRDVADPYIATMAQTLEIPETQVKIKDSYIQKALSQRTPDGTSASQPMWQFVRQLKDDARYDQTTQAKQDAFATLAKVGKDFGFVGAGN